MNLTVRAHGPTQGGPEVESQVLRGLPADRRVSGIVEGIVDNYRGGQLTPEAVYVQLGNGSREITADLRANRTLQDVGLVGPNGETLGDLIILFPGHPPCVYDVD